MHADTAGTRHDCGDRGQRCCDERDADTYDHACGIFSLCVFGICSPCGYEGQSCCGEFLDGFCHDIDLGCNARGICEVVCGRAGLRCCTADDSPPDISDAGTITYGAFPLHDFERCDDSITISDYTSSDTYCSSDDICTLCGRGGLPCCPGSDGAACLSFHVGYECDGDTNLCSPPPSSPPNAPPATSAREAPLQPPQSTSPLPPPARSPRGARNPRSPRGPRRLTADT